MPGLFFGFRLRLRQSSFHWIGVISGIGRNWNRSGSAYDSDFRFSLVRSAYDSDYDSDSNSVASENQPLHTLMLTWWNDIIKTYKEVHAISFTGSPSTASGKGNTDDNSVCVP